MKSKEYTQDVITAYSFLIPLILVVYGFVGYPFIKAIFLSLSEKFVGNESTSFIGLDNFYALFNDFIFRRAFKNTIIWTFGSVVFKLILGMILALILNHKYSRSNFTIGLVLVPWIMPTPISGLVWLWIFNDMGGVLNSILMQLNIIEFPVAWLGDGKLALASVISVNIWRGTPFFAITILAALKTIPKNLYEAADIAGANNFQKFIHITLPSIKNVILIACLLESIWALGDFSIVYVMTKGGPAGATHLLSTLTYEVGFMVGNLGKAVAVSIFPLPILALLIIAITYFMERDKK